MKNYSITFCTACMGRAHQIKETYIQNIEDNLPHGNVDFVLLNYNSPDDIDQWVSKNLKNYIDKKIVTYLKTSKPAKWSMSITKNITGRHAKNDIICWLDADNFTGKFFTKYLRREFNKNRDIVCRVRGGRGCSGRVSILKKYFEEIKGYDESFVGWGHDDTDFSERCKHHFGLEEIRISNQTNKDEKPDITADYICKKNPVGYALTHDITNPNRQGPNKKISQQNIDSGRYIVNDGQWGVLL